MIQVTVRLILIHTDEFIFFGFTKTKTGAKNAPRAPKLGYFDGRAPLLSARVTLVPSGAGVVCHM